MSTGCSRIDSLQFVYKRNRGTDDAVQTMMNCVTYHLQNPNAYFEILHKRLTK